MTKRKTSEPKTSAQKSNNDSTLIPPDMAMEIERYVQAQQAKHPDKAITLNDVLRKLLRFGLDKAKSYAFVPVKLPVPSAPPPAPPLPFPMPLDETMTHGTVTHAFEPSSGIVMPVSPPEEVVTHAWAPGLVLPCGVWKRGNRHAATPERIDCKACLAALRGRGR